MDHVSTDMFFEDISTEAVALSAEAGRLTRQYGEIMDRLPVGVVVHHQQGLIYLNEAARRILGAEAVPGSHISDFGRVIGDCAFIDMIGAALAGTETKGTLEIVHADGVHVVDIIVARVSWPGVPAVQVVLQDVTERARLIHSLEVLATRDPLTGLSNRRHFLELSGVLVQQSRRHEQPLCGVLIDIDRFKRVNDTYGHAAGDVVIREVTQRCQRVLRKADVFGRLGGEEFAASLAQTTLEGARILAERLRVAVAETPVAWEGEAIPVTISLGLALLHAGEDIAALLGRADQALYVAKRAGRNRVEIAPPPIIPAET